jgi:DNA-binding NarL/FixJ family response regulator
VPGPRKVVLYGNSLFLAGVEASLTDRTGLEVSRLEANLPDALERLDALGPDVVILDMAESNAEFALKILKEHPGLPLIGLDLSKNNQVLVLSGQKREAFTAHDLTTVILSQRPAPRH